jgi:hypothetical protein
MAPLPAFLGLFLAVRSCALHVLDIVIIEGVTIVTRDYYLLLLYYYYYYRYRDTALTATQLFL